MELPLILVNFKAYVEGASKNALRLAKICEDVSKKFKTNIAIAPQYTDIYQIAKEVKINIFAQHIDYQEPGAFTGHVSVVAIKEAGAIGSLINHSEKKLKLEEIPKHIETAKKYKLITVCCAATSEEARGIAKYKPDFIAVEPPELISSGIAVSKARPELITKTIEKVKEIDPEIKVLCGAGITSGEDVKKAIELGTQGVLVASAVVKAKNPKKVLADFAKAIKQT